MRWQLPLLILLLLLCAHCGETERPTARPTQASPPPQRQGELVFITDLGGYLEPCGCQSTSLGGLDRTATKLAQLRAERPDLALVVAGDLLFEEGGLHQRSDDDARTQELWKSGTIVDILGHLHTAAAFFGPGDLNYGQEAFAEATKGAPFTTLGPLEPAADALPTLVRHVGDLEVGLLFAELSERQAPAATRLTATAEGLRKGHADVVIAVTHGDFRRARQLAVKTKGIDFFVATGRDSDEPTPPEQLGRTVLLTGGRHGRGLLVLDLHVSKPNSPFADDSAWTQASARAAKRRAIDDLTERIAAWNADPKVDKALVRKQQERLEEMKAELEPSPSRANGNHFEARYVPITQDIPGAEKVSEQMATYDARVNAHNKEAFADRKPRPAPKGQASYIGSEACGGCHASALAWWKTHPHGHAYDTLVERNKQYNLSCVGCHVTGYEQPGGSTVTHNAGLVHVGCESCHGPGSLHLADPKQIVRAPVETTCLGCHNAEHSDQFDFATYRARLIVPGHGLPDGQAEAKP